MKDLIYNIDNPFFQEAVTHLQRLIAIPSYSNEEDKAADEWVKWLEAQGVENVERFHNNIYALTPNFNPGKPVLMLNSHIDTVKPVDSYTFNPFSGEIKDGKIFGLGSNDAGGAGISLAATFLELRKRSDLPFNLLLALTASEEKMGELGMRAFLPHLREKGLYPDMVIVGEPTGGRAAIAEKGLVVCDALAKGEAGHAARNEGINAIYRAMEDINSLKDIKWPKISSVLGPIKVSVTMINSGTQHNVVPDKCSFVVDIRTTDAYSNEETVDFLRNMMKWSSLTPRSTRIHASVLPEDNPLFKAAIDAGLETFISPTTSDMALMYDIPSIKIGPGESARSHTADEFITLDEIKKGMKIYKEFLNSLKNYL